MREIKFRAWLKREKEYMDVVGMEFTPKGITVWQKLDEDYTFLPDDAAVEQFTGIIDNNGKEIYEGDIVSFDVSGGRKNEPPTKNQRGVVGWAGNGWNFGAWDSRYCYYTTILGNIHENENLAEKGGK